MPKSRLKYWLIVLKWDWWNKKNSGTSKRMAQKSQLSSTVARTKALISIEPFGGSTL